MKATCTPIKPNIKKELGKITRAEYGFGGREDCIFGLLNLSFEGKNWGVSACICEDKIKSTLQAANITYVSGLIGIPVEVTFEGSAFKEFRVLEEVL